MPQLLLEQLVVGGRLVAPVGGARQRLVMIERVAEQRWERHELEETLFVPLLSRIQV